ncbi:JHBP domain containing protein, partial [Asbolus verrucosus]
MVTAAQDAISQLKKSVPEVGLPSLEPVVVSHLIVAPGPELFQVRQNYTNLSNFGFTTARVSKFDVHFENNTIDMEFTVPKLRIEFDYDYDGKILLVPIKGTGHGQAMHNDTNFIVTFNLEEYQKDGEIFFKVVESKVTLSIKELKVHFENFVPINKGVGLGLSIPADPNKLINDNWRTIFSEVHSDFEKSYAETFTVILNNLLEKVPISELFVIITTINVTIISKKLASSFKKCDRKQDDFNQCLVTAVQDAVRQLEKPFPEVGLPSLEPIETSHLTVAPGPNVFQVQQSYENFNNFGFTTAEVSKFEIISLTRNFYRFQLKELDTPRRFSVNDTNFIVTFYLKEYQKDDETFIKVVESKITLLPEEVELNFGNLVPTVQGTGLGLDNPVDPSNR